MDQKSKRTASMMVVALFFLVLSAPFQGCFSKPSQPPSKIQSTESTSTSRFGSSVVFPITGNVYPLGYYSVSLSVGNPPKLFDFDIDTGSDLTWLQCDAPCTGCTKPRDSLYKPKRNIVPCEDPICTSLHWPNSYQCENPSEQCDYEVGYADHGSSLGVLVRDSFNFRLTNGSLLSPSLNFGCGYDHKNPGPNSPPPTAGVIGLGHGKVSILSQMHGLGVTKNVIGHCLSNQGGGFLFFGDDLVPSSRIVWTPMLRKPSDNHYAAGPAELLFAGRSTGQKGLDVVFDSGSSFTYFSSQVHKAILNLIKGDLKGKPLKDAPEDHTLPFCWKGAKPFKSVNDAKSYFKPLALSFTKAKNAQLQLPPEAYLIITEYGNVCLGILNGTEVGLENSNIIGDISMQNKMVIYDNEKQQIGWASANCDRLPNVDRDYDEAFSQSYAANFGIIEGNLAATHGPEMALRLNSKL